MKIITPSVTLVTYTQDPLETIYQAYRRCYSSEPDLPELEDSETMYLFVRRMLSHEHPHESPLEHASFTFHMTCSRSTSHQLVRHRLASYSQQSQRYVKADELEVIAPASIMEDSALRYGFELHIKEAEGMYRGMVNSGVRAEDARSILPNAVATRLMMTMNTRELLHFFQERCCERAQEEIRTLAWSMLAQCYTILPAVFTGAGPHCYRLKHCPESKPCGKQPWKERNA